MTLVSQKTTMLASLANEHGGVGTQSSVPVQRIVLDKQKIGCYDLERAADILGASNIQKLVTERWVGSWRYFFLLWKEDGKIWVSLLNKLSTLDNTGTKFVRRGRRLIFS